MMLLLAFGRDVSDAWRWYGARGIRRPLASRFRRHPPASRSPLRGLCPESRLSLTRYRVAVCERFGKLPVEEAHVVEAQVEEGQVEAVQAEEAQAEEVQAEEAQTEEAQVVEAQEAQLVEAHKLLRHKS